MYQTLFKILKRAFLQIIVNEWYVSAVRNMNRYLEPFFGIFYKVAIKTWQKTVDTRVTESIEAKIDYLQTLLNGINVQQKLWVNTIWHDSSNAVVALFAAIDPFNKKIAVTFAFFLVFLRKIKGKMCDQWKIWIDNIRLWFSAKVFF